MPAYPKEDLLRELRQFEVKFNDGQNLLVHDSLLQVHSGFYQACRETSPEITLDPNRVDPDSLQTIHKWIDASQLQSSDQLVTEFRDLFVPEGSDFVERLTKLYMTQDFLDVNPDFRRQLLLSLFPVRDPRNFGGSRRGEPALEPEDFSLLQFLCSLTNNQV